VTKEVEKLSREADHSEGAPVDATMSSLSAAKDALVRSSFSLSSRRWNGATVMLTSSNMYRIVIDPCHFVRFCATDGIGSRRSLTLESARSMLGLSDQTKFSLRDLRDAYFAAAKQCHPDVAKHNNQKKKSAGDSISDDDDDESTSTSSDRDPHADFLQLTTAYELIQSELLDTGTSSQNELDSLITYDEEQEFRLACERHLGLSAEVVEECKRSVPFRQWLDGRTDAAHLWRDFFAQNGGLAPKLSASLAYIEAGGKMRSDGTSTIAARRRRRR